jgi:hypothetical protein
MAFRHEPEDHCDASLLAPADDYLARVWRTPLEIGDDGKFVAWRAKARSYDRVCDLASLPLPSGRVALPVD